MNCRIRLDWVHATRYIQNINNYVPLPWKALLCSVVVNAIGCHSNEMDERNSERKTQPPKQEEKETERESMSEEDESYRTN